MGRDYLWQRVWWQQRMKWHNDILEEGEGKHCGDGPGRAHFPRSKVSHSPWRAKDEASGPLLLTQCIGHQQETDSLFKVLQPTRSQEADSYAQGNSVEIQIRYGPLRPANHVPPTIATQQQAMGQGLDGYQLQLKKSPPHYESAGDGLG